MGGGAGFAGVGVEVTCGCVFGELGREEAAWDLKLLLAWYDVTALAEEGRSGDFRLWCVGCVLLAEPSRASSRCFSILRPVVSVFTA